MDTIIVMTNDVKCRDTDYIDFLIGSPKLFSCTEAAKVQPKGPNPPAHDAFTRLLIRLEPDFRNLVARGPTARPPQGRAAGPRRFGLGQALRQGDGPGHPPLVGQSTTPSSAASTWSPCCGPTAIARSLATTGFMTTPKDGLTKNDHFRAMVKAAHERGFAPDCVAFDGWYGSLENLKLIRGLGWHWADAAEGQPPGQPRPAGDQGGRRDGDRGRWDDSPSGRLRPDPGLQDRLPRRGH